jgi:thymidylate synthase
MYDADPVSKYEMQYLKMLQHIMVEGSDKQTRNAMTRSVFGMQMKVDMSDGYFFPMLRGRKMYPKGVLGEFAAMLRGPKHVQDFKDFGCNYWGQWADDNGNLDVDYGNAWIDWNGVNQIDELVRTLKTNPNDRRMLVSGWRPDRVPNQSLPCCHMLYQWYVDGDYLDMIWYQRSVDMMVGLPSDVILAAVWNIMLANEVGLQPGVLTFMLGDCHVYEQHFKAFTEYRDNVNANRLAIEGDPATYTVNAPNGQRLLNFSPEDITIDFKPGPKIELEVLA